MNAGASNAPAPTEPIPREPARLAHALAATSAALNASIDRWLTAGRPAAPRPPASVELHALYQQRIYRLLARDERLASRVIPRLPSRLARTARATIGAARKVASLLPAVAPKRRWRVGRPLPAGVLLGYYRQAQRRFGVAWQVLAAVNFVESAFGRVRSASTAGAQGPMQFMPATWRAYGLGGDVHDPHDAILGAANYLRASGAPGDYRRALYAYNRSSEYVDAVFAYAREITKDRRAYFAFYSWQVFARTSAGDRRLTGPGLRHG